MSGRIGIALSLALVMQVAACAPTRKLLVQADTAQASSEARSEEPIDIVGYTTREGVHAAFSGTVRLEGEGYFFRPHSNTSRPFTLPKDRIESFDVVAGTPASGFAVVVLIILGVAMGLILTPHIHWSG